VALPPPAAPYDHLAGRSPHLPGASVRPEPRADRLAAFTVADARDLTLIVEPTSLDVEELDLLHAAATGLR